MITNTCLTGGSFVAARRAADEPRPIRPSPPLRAAGRLGVASRRPPRVAAAAARGRRRRAPVQAFGGSRGGRFASPPGGRLRRMPDVGARSRAGSALAAARASSAAREAASVSLTRELATCRRAARRSRGTRAPAAPRPVARERQTVSSPQTRAAQPALRSVGRASRSAHSLRRRRCVARDASPGSTQQRRELRAARSHALRRSSRQ